MMRGVFTVQGSRLRSTVGARLACARTQLLHDQFRATILSKTYPCVLGASALRTGNYAFALYRELGDIGSARRLAGDIDWFVRTHPVPHMRGQPFATFIAIFDGPSPTCEEQFEWLLWQHLGLLHEQDRERFSWDPAVSTEVEDPNFSFSVAGRAFFVVGLHPLASRVSRLTPLPALVFNAHEQFEELRRRGEMGRISKVIRARDERLNGRPYLALADYGEMSEARQYAGREVGSDWRCPFRPKPPSTGLVAFADGAST
jgi:uncharacterized protein